MSTDPAPRKRVRVIQYVVQPVLVVDDGTNLEPLQVDPLQIAAAGWAEFVETGLAAAMAQLEEQVNAPPSG